MKDFTVKITNVDTVDFPVAIKGNFAEMQAELATMMQAYAGLEVTEENLPERKKDVATLRKIKSAIEDKRKAVKREYAKPLTAFEAECKKLTGIIDKEVTRITAEMDVYEQKRIAAKRERCAELYRENIGKFEEYLPAEYIKKPEWDNKTYSEAAVITDIQEAIMQVKSDLSVIESMCGEWVAECTAAYKAHGNSLVSALQRAKDLASAKQAAEAAVLGSEQQAGTNTPVAPAKPAERPVWRFTVTVHSEDDARIIRDTCNACGFDYKEG